MASDVRRFAIAAEGITDQAVIEMLLYGYLDERFSVVVNVVQPTRDATDESRQANEKDENGFGGWENVLEFCQSSGRLSEALDFNDFLVVHIDTDVCENARFDVDLTVGGRHRDVHDLVYAVWDRLIQCFGAEFYRQNHKRIIFAVAVHSLEFWLFPIYSGKKLSAGKLCCQQLLIDAVCAKDRKFRYVKDYKCYSKLAKPFSKHKGVCSVLGVNESFDIFLYEVDRAMAGAPALPM